MEETAVKERTFEEALEEAKKYLDRITVCYEFETGYEFGDDSIDSIGGLVFVGVWKDPSRPTMNEYSFIEQLFNDGVPNEPIKETRIDWSK